MKLTKIILSVIVLNLLNSACTPSDKQTTSNQSKDSIAQTSAKPLNNLVSIIEIPVSDFERAVGFYQNILKTNVEEMTMDSLQMGVFHNDSGTVNLLLVKGKDYKPTTDGALVYLNGGDDLQVVLNNVETNGGKIIVPKTAINPEIGFFALFIDTEGNKIGLHSKK
ncbi:MAG TPA: VOC family protein [Bacteroidia bacterium]